MNNTHHTTILQSINFENLIGIYLVSNTPAYLYKHFRSSTTIYELSRESVIDLTSEYMSISSKVEKNLEDIVKAYSIICAFTFKSSMEAEDFFSKADMDFLDWGEFIQKLFLSTASSEKIIFIDAPPPRVLNLNLNQVSISESDSATKTVNITAVHSPNISTVISNG